MKRIGIYGGTFAPVHNGHIHVAKAMKAACDLDTLLIMPNKTPPHKIAASGDSPQHRLQMLRLAFPESESAQSGISVSTFEIESTSPSYTALTLEHFSSPDTELFFFCGTDMFETLETWYHPEVIFARATIAHMQREHLSAEQIETLTRLGTHYEQTYDATIVHLSIPPLPLSSTKVRNAIKAGQDISAFVPSAVAAYIRENDLYREGAT